MLSIFFNIFRKIGWLSEINFKDNLLLHEIFNFILGILIFKLLFIIYLFDFIIKFYF